MSMKYARIIFGVAVLIFVLITVFSLRVRHDFVENPEQKLRISAVVFPGYVSDNTQNYKIKDGKLVYYTNSQTTLVDSVDLLTFTAFTNHYAKDRFHVYVDGKIFHAADISTFLVLNESYAKDKYYVYFGPEILVDADTATFVPYEYWYGKDAKNVFYEDFIIKGADPLTFVTFTGTEYSKDKNAVYFLGRILPSADPRTFQMLGQNYSRDKTNIFYLSDKIPEARAATFSVIENDTHDYATDGTYVYEDGEIIKGANPKTFVPNANPPKY